MRPDFGITATFRLLLFLGVATKGCWGPRVQDIRVPSVVVSGSMVRLICNYEHRTDRFDPLYSVKWYRGVDQFYEYMPKKSPPVRVYELANLRVDKDSSNKSTVVLTGVTKETSGTFRCEVMGEKPLFETDDSSRNMTVVDIPLWGPEIKGLGKNPRVRPGEIVEVQCRVGYSDPPAKFTWCVNKEDLPAHARTIYTTERDEKARMAQIFTLQIELDEESFLKGAVTLTCETQVSSVYSKNVSVTLLHADHPQPSEFGWFSAGNVSNRN